MTITSTVTAIQAKAAAISGVLAAPSTYPGSLNTAEMPICICWPDAGESAQAGPGFNRVMRNYRLSVYLMPTEQGQGIAEGWADANTFLQRFIDKFLDKDNRLLVNDGTYQVQIVCSRDNPMTDGGITVLAYPPQATGVDGYPHYFGFELTVPIKETWSET